MHRAYVSERLTTRQVAERFGVDRKTVERSFARYGLPRSLHRPRPGPYEPEWYPDVE